MNIEEFPDKDITIDKEWLKIFYKRVADQFALARNSLHNTHQWAITLTFGIVTAIFTIADNGDYPNTIGLVVLLLTFPLLLRFFFRSCLEWSIQCKWQIILNNLDKYYLNPCLEEKVVLLECINNYYFDWKSPQKLSKIVWNNLRLAYIWPFLLYIGLIIWGFFPIVSSKSIPIVIQITSISAIMLTVIEAIGLGNYRGFRTKEIDE